MNFHDAYEAMKKGKKVKRSWWKSTFWFWDMREETFKMTFYVSAEDKEETRFVDDEGFDNVAEHISANDWEVATRENCSLLKHNTFGFYTAKDFIQKGRRVTREAWPNKDYRFDLAERDKDVLSIEDIFADDWYLVEEDD